MATGVKISALTPATSFDSTDLIPIVEGGVTKSITHDVLMDDTQICKAWVNFNGTGTVAIRDDDNVSSITDDGTGDYTVNFTNALSDANYSVVSNANVNTLAYAAGQRTSASKPNNLLTTSVGISTLYGATSATASIKQDMEIVTVHVFGS